MKYFGTDGIRGKVNKTLFVDTAFRVGKALHIFACKEIVLGYDSRSSNKMLAYALASGAMSVGINVIMVGVASTPSIVYYSYIKNLVGVIITASHNPYEDNGIKIVSNGEKIKETMEQKIEEVIDSDYTTYGSFGMEIDCSDFMYLYLTFLKSLSIDSSDRIAIDCSNGATTDFARMLFPKAQFIGCTPNGTNINLNVGSTHIFHLQKYVLTNNLSYGFAFDGDGDRIIMVDSIGRIYGGDAIAYLLIKYFKDTNQLKHNLVATTIMSNLGVVKAINALGIEVLETAVGDRNISTCAKENDLSIAWESSGHIILPDLVPSGDGIIIALMIQRIIAYYDKPIEALFSISLYPEVSYTIPLSEISKKKEEVDCKIKELKERYDGKIIIRESGTEPILRVYYSLKDSSRMEELRNEIEEYLRG